MRSRAFGFAFLFSLFALVLAAFISLSACTAAQKQAALNAVNATTQPTQQIENGASAAAATLPAPLNVYASAIAAAAALALAVEKALADYVIPAIKTKADPTTATPAVANANPIMSAAPLKPQVLPS